MDPKRRKKNVPFPKEDGERFSSGHVTAAALAQAEERDLEAGRERTTIQDLQAQQEDARLQQAIAAATQREIARREEELRRLVQREDQRRDIAEITERVAGLQLSGNIKKTSRKKKISKKNKGTRNGRKKSAIKKKRVKRRKSVGGKRRRKGKKTKKRG